MKKILISLLLLSIGSFVAFAQNENGKTDEEKIYELVEEQVEKMTENLGLDPAQEFYVDSIMLHDYSELQAELNAMSKSKVSNPDLYVQVQDKWMEKMYQEFEKLFTPEQWDKFLKSGALREKKARDKRAAKAGK
ncbi:MAG: hypothetical protein MJY80_00580 [Bacteroidales bacterium]|nr:hypothetical protein [Bacteroidales bacterium]